MSKSDEDGTEVKVVRTTRTTKTVRMFWYGAHWRVQYTKTSNDRNDSRLLQWLDEDYPTRHAYGEIVSIIS